MVEVPKEEPKKKRKKSKKSASRAATPKKKKTPRKKKKEPTPPKYADGSINYGRPRTEGFGAKRIENISRISISLS